MNNHIYSHDDRVEILSTNKQGTVWLTNGRFITVRMDDGITWKGQTDEIKPLVKLTCQVCKTDFWDEEPKMCCNGRDCGCLGQPIDPIVCSVECYEKLTTPRHTPASNIHPIFEQILKPYTL